jgi:hypothetical protein
MNEKFKQMHNFDSLLGEAIHISTKHGIIMGEAAWFRILEFLSDYTLRILDRIKAGLPKKAISVEDKLKLDRVKDFVDSRKTMVLRNLPGNISLQRLTERLDLDFKEINTIYENKVIEYRENQKYFKIANKL